MLNNGVLCKKFRCLLIVYRRIIRKFINVVKINMIEAHPREIVVLNVVGSSPTGHPTKRHRRKAMSFFCFCISVFLFCIFPNIIWQSLQYKLYLQRKIINNSFFCTSGFAEGTLARKYSNKFGISLAYSYLCTRWIYRVSSYHF